MHNRQIQAWLILIVILAAVLTFSAIPYLPKHSIYNSSEVGSSELRESIETTLNISTSRILVSPLILESQSNNIKLIIIIGSERSYSESEIQAYYDFVLSGGTLILFEDFGPAKKIAEKMQITYFTGTLKERNPSLYINRPSQFLVRDVLISQISEDLSIGPILVSEAAGIIDVIGMVRKTTVPILATYPSAIIDKNDNNIIDENDISNSFGFFLGLFKQIGRNNGSIVVIGDASIPLNQYWNKKITINFPNTGETAVFTLANSLWTLLIIFYMYQISGATSIVFDESHQAIAINSAAGIFNLIAGTWVGLINSSFVTLLIIFTTITFSTLRLRKNIRYFNKNRRKGQYKSDNIIEEYISHPSSAEKGISEQFILYQVMGSSYLHVVNSHLLSQLKSTKKADEFIKLLENEYGGLYQPNSLDVLLEIHNKLRVYVDKEKSKWL